jgi:anti-anti-sigma factor
VILFVVIGLGSAVLSWRDMVLLGIVSMLTIGMLTILNVYGLIGSLTKPLPVVYYGIVYALLIGFVSILGCLSTRSNERPLSHIIAQADAIVEQNNELTLQRSMLHQQQAELEHHRTQLEQEVQNRTTELQVALEEIRRGAVALRELQSPIVPIADGVLVVPLIGGFDRARAQQFVQDILEGVELRRAHTVLLDVTGLPVIDTLAARTLLDAAVAVQLLGARLILVGIAPAVAQTIVGLGIDLRNLRIERDLQSAVERVLVSQAAPLYPWFRYSIPLAAVSAGLLRLDNPAIVSAARLHLLEGAVVT